MERRNIPEERRKIPRFSDPVVKDYTRQVKSMTAVFCLLTFITAVFKLYVGVVAGTAMAISYALFVSVIFILLTVFSYRYYQSLKDYIENESVTNLNRSMERLSLLLVLLCFCYVLYAVVYAIF